MRSTLMIPAILRPPPLLVAAGLGVLGCPGGAGDTAPVDPQGRMCSDGAPWVHVSAGYELTCGIREGGCVECWGREDWAYQSSSDRTPETDRIDYGELDVPNRVFASLTHVRGPTVTGWDQRACGITDTGKLQCWGKDNYEGTTSVPVSDPVAVAVDEWVTCALDTDGDVQCNYEAYEPPVGEVVAIDIGGGVGGATTAAGDLVVWDPRGDGDRPAFTLEGPITDIGMGMPTCALRADGALDCFTPWGSSAPFGDAGPSGTYTSVCGGSWGAVCAIRTDGRPECWYEADRSTPEEEVPVPDVHLTQLSCGSLHQCGVTVDGDIACWGAVGSWLDVPP